MKMIQTLARFGPLPTWLAMMGVDVGAPLTAIMVAIMVALLIGAVETAPTSAMSYSDDRRDGRHDEWRRDDRYDDKHRDDRRDERRCDDMSDERRHDDRYDDKLYDEKHYDMCDDRRRDDMRRHDHAPTPYVDVTCQICKIHGHSASDCWWRNLDDSDDDDPMIKLYMLLLMGLIQTGTLTLELQIISQGH
jgi:hypothetical protein